VENIEVKVRGENLVIPYRIYSSPPSELLLRLSTEETRLRTYCSYTRHHDGYLREKYLKKVIDSDLPVVTPYIFQLCGEYVVEVVSFVFENKERINQDNLKDFIRSNPSYFQKTRDRMISYWDCYYRHQSPKLKDYVGYQLFAYFDHLGREPSNISVNPDALKRAGYFQR
jgi:hypothetical protein